MISELKNYIANMNTSGNMALNITKATAYLKNQKRQFENQLTPEAAKTYTSLLGEIKNFKREIYVSPEYENQLRSYAKERTDLKSAIEKKQERENCFAGSKRAVRHWQSSNLQTPSLFCLLKSRRGYLPPVPGSRTGRLKEITRGELSVFLAFWDFCCFWEPATSSAGDDARQFLPALDAGNH